MNKKLLQISIAILLLSITSLQAQQTPAKIKRRSLLEAKNGAELQVIHQQNIQAELAYARDVLKLSTAPQLQENGSIIQLVGVSESGIPIYNKTDNTGAAQTIGTNKVNPGGSMGLSLSGSGMTNRLGIWDGGGVRVTHQEFQGRATQMDSPSPSLSDHATHVAGTMIAGGVQANAKGMAFQAPIKCYDWTNDDGEMSNAAGAGMLISNHSYGTICGWFYDDAANVWKWYGDVSSSSAEDAKFGQYNSDAQSWDQLVYDNPFYLPFKSAGNDRGDYPNNSEPKQYFDNGIWTTFVGNIPPADGPYDCVSTNGTAKNIITIGAVQKITGGWSSANSVVMSTFSGWGPTDDGRIKPDICAAGVNLTSSYSGSNTAYSTISGTSMSSPSASGSALLIQQHHNNLRNRFMRAATLKGLIIHTADEAGNAPGPDYSFGWGLMNTAKAVETITDTNKNAIIESQLNANNGNPYTRTIVADGSTPLKVTLCWTDIPGSTASGALDESTKRLVNDLDVRLTRISDNTTFLPYVLNPATPAAAATNGDNTRDNVEQIFLGTPSAGNYTITVSNKGTLASGANQSFSLLISGISPKPAANFTISKDIICSGEQVSYTSSSGGAVTLRWYFPGGVPATSTLANPTVTYPTAGTYPAALRVTSVSGTDSIYKINVIKVGGLSLPFLETFETNSTTRELWTQSNNNGDATYWGRYDNVAGTSPGNTAMGINNFDNANAGYVDVLVSPAFDLKGLQTASLSFNHAYTRYLTSDRDSLIIIISTNCGNNWTRVTGFTETRPGAGSRLATYTGSGDANQTATNFFTPTIANDWCSGNANSTPCINIDLTPYVGSSNVKIGFMLVQDGGNNLYLDNINITGVPFKPKTGFVVPPVVCASSPFTITDTTQNNPTSWEWTVSGPTNQTANVKNPTFNFSQTGFYTVKLKTSNVSGSDSLTVSNSFEVKGLPPVPVVTLTGNLALCNGDSATLTTTGSGLLWYKDSVALSGSTGISINVKTAGKYAVRRTNSSGCSSQSTIFAITVGTNPPVPTITTNLAGNSFCDGGTFVLTSSADNNQWLRNDVDLSSQTAKTLTFNDSGSFKVKAFNGGCFSTSLPLYISKLSRPVTSDIVASRQAYKNDTATYSVANAVGSTYTWVVTGGVVQSGSGTNKILVKWNSGATAGSVAVTERNTNLCSGVQKTLAISVFTIGVKNNNATDNQFYMYPNPISNQLNIKWIGASANGIKVNIFDVLGKSIFHYTFNFTVGEEQMIDLSTIPKGIYFLKMETGSGSVSKMFIKE